MIIDKKLTNKINTNELDLSDNVAEEECMVLLESKGCRLPKNAEFPKRRYYVSDDKRTLQQR
jgi:hypothetical protein